MSLTGDEVAALKEWLDGKMDAQSARFEASMLRAFNEHRKEDHDGLEKRMNSLEADAKGDRRIARWGIGGLTGLTGLLEFLHRVFDSVPPGRHP